VDRLKGELLLTLLVSPILFREKKRGKKREWGNCECFFLFWKHRLDPDGERESRRKTTALSGGGKGKERIDFASFSIDPHHKRGGEGRDREVGSDGMLAFCSVCLYSRIQL